MVTSKPGYTHDKYVLMEKNKLPSRLTESFIGHLPKEVSTYTYYIILHGAKVSAMVMDTHHRRSPLVQGMLRVANCGPTHAPRRSHLETKLSTYNKYTPEEG